LEYFHKTSSLNSGYTIHELNRFFDTILSDHELTLTRHFSCFLRS